MCGSIYVIDYAVAALEIEAKDNAYKYYITDMLSAMAKSIGVRVRKRFYDIIHPAPVDRRSAEEIIADITARAGLVRSG